jgi:flagellin-specific chaperone FliS
MDKIEQAIQLLNEYTKDRDDDKLLKAEQIFTEIYNSLELKDSVKARFHEEF